MTPQRIRLRGATSGLEDRTWESTTCLAIGRLDNQEIMLTDASISRRHAEVICSEEGWVVRDLGSTNGTFLNGVRVGRADQRLRKGDSVQCGNCSLLVVALEELPVSHHDTPGNGMLVEFTVQNTWEQALLEAAPLDQMTALPGRDRLLTLLRVGRDFSHATTMKDLLEGILRDTMAALDADGGSLVLIDEVTGQLGAQLVSSRPHDDSLAYSKSIAQRSLRTGESLLCQDARELLETKNGRTANDPVVSSMVCDLTNKVLPLATPAAEAPPVASLMCALLRSPRKRLGVLQLERGATKPAFSKHDLALVDALAASVSATIESVDAFQAKEHALFLQTLTALAQTVDLRDDYTGSHTQRVTDYALLLAEAMELSPLERTHLQNGTPLHDIGKIGISDAILRKPTQLTEEEVEYMKSHTWKGAAILEAIPSLAPLIPIVRSHHERWDGHGYPDGLAGESISILARIVAVTDAFDAMTTDRPYRPAMTVDKALQEIWGEGGKHLDPECVRAFCGLRMRLKELHARRDQVFATVAQPVLQSPEPASPEPPSTERRGRTLAIPMKALAEYLERAVERVG